MSDRVRLEGDISMSPDRGLSMTKAIRESLAKKNIKSATMFLKGGSEIKAITGLGWGPGGLTVRIYKDHKTFACGLVDTSEIAGYISEDSNQSQKDIEEG